MRALTPRITRSGVLPRLVMRADPYPMTADTARKSLSVQVRKTPHCAVRRPAVPSARNKMKEQARFMIVSSLERLVLRVARSATEAPLHFRQARQSRGPVAPGDLHLGARLRGAPPRAAHPGQRDAEAQGAETPF